MDKADNKESNISDDLVADYEEFGAADVDRRAMGDENDDEEICSDIDEVVVFCCQNIDKFYYSGGFRQRR